MGVACGQPVPVDHDRPVTATPARIETQPTATSTGLTSQVPPTIEPSASPFFPAPTNQVLTVWIEPYVPVALSSSLVLRQGFELVDHPDEADFHFGIGDDPSLSKWIYALVAPFPTIPDGVTREDLLRTWNGEESGPFAGAPLLMDEGTIGAFSTSWGVPALGAVVTLPTDKLLDYAWEHRPAWAIVPFERLEPRWKVLEIDGQSPVRKGFDSETYMLTLSFGLQAGDGSATGSTPVFSSHLLTNRDPLKLTTLAMTGVTALVRGTALTMEQRGVTFPAQYIGEILRDADLTHVSNEIPFTPDCPYPELYPTQLVFCSDPGYIKLLEEIGTDIVELTGDHFGDYQSEAMIFTLDLYAQAGLPYYGGGVNAEQARQSFLVEHNGNRVAFLGCNIGCQVKSEVPCSALATDDQPGAAACDFDWMSAEVASLRDEGYLVVVTFQHREYYNYVPEPDLMRDFRRVAEAGANIVSGSQAHVPHSLAFDNGALIHYGLGNLFFDQYHFCAYYACDDAFIDRHVFYDGRYLSTELLTLRFVDMARPRLMTLEERAHFLEIIFEASGW